MTPPGRAGPDQDTMEGLLRSRRSTPAEEPCPGLELVALAGEGEEETAAAAEHLQGCQSCAEAVLVLSGLHNRGVFSSPSPRSAPGAKYLSRPFLLAAAAAVLLVVVVAIGQFSRPPAGETGEMVVKGLQDDLFLAVQRGDHRFRLPKNQTLQPGDKLGFFYSALEDGYLAVFDLEQGGDSTLLFPSGGRYSARIEAGQEMPLPDGGEVVGGSGCEWVVAVFSRDRMKITEIQEIFRTSTQMQKACELDIPIPVARTVRVMVVSGR